MRISIFAAALLALASPAFALSAQPPAQGAASPVTTPAISDADDPFIWLEDAESPKAIKWAEAENARAFKVLQGDPRYDTLHAEALKIATASDRIPTPGFRAGAIYNLWQDADHVQGLWRRTTLDSYRLTSPAWETVLDLDALAKADGKTWVWKGAVCLKPAERLCILQLSDGGEDAVELREFDLKAKAFVPGGFHLPRGKQDAAWLDSKTLLVSRDWGAGDHDGVGLRLRGQDPDPRPGAGPGPRGVPRRAHGRGRQPTGAARRPGPQGGAVRAVQGLLPHRALAVGARGSGAPEPARALHRPGPAERPADHDAGAGLDGRGRPPTRPAR